MIEYYLGSIVVVVSLGAYLAYGISLGVRHRKVLTSSWLQIPLLGICWFPAMVWAWWLNLQDELNNRIG